MSNSSMEIPTISMEIPAISISSSTASTILTTSIGSSREESSFSSSTIDLTTVTVNTSTETSPETTVAAGVTGDQGDDSVVLGIIIALVVLVVLCLLTLTVYCYRRKRGKQRKKVPPELPNPHEMTNAALVEDSVLYITPDPNVISTDRSQGARLSTSSDSNIHILGYKTLEPTRMPPRKGSIPTSHAPALPASHEGEILDSTRSVIQGNNTESIYANEDIVNSSGLSAVGTVSGASSSLEIKNAGMSQASSNSMYVHPDDWQGITVTLTDRKFSTASYQVEDGNGGSISRNRLDSQKYLLPAELILQLPKDMRKYSDPSMSTNTISKSHKVRLGHNRSNSIDDISTSEGINLKWKITPTIVHKAATESDTLNRTSSLYMDMDNASDSMPESSPPVVDQRENNARKQSIQHHELHSTSRPPPAPCKYSINSYINLSHNNSNIHSSAEVPTSSQIVNTNSGYYVDVSALSEPPGSEIYQNIDDTPSGGIGDVTSGTVDNIYHNDDDTYKVFISTAATNDKDGKSESNQETNDPYQDSNSDQETSEQLSYVNVSEFQKFPKNPEENTNSKAETDIVSVTSQLAPDQKAKPKKFPKPSKSKRLKPIFPVPDHSSSNKLLNPSLRTSSETHISCTNQTMNNVRLTSDSQTKTPGKVHIPVSPSLLRPARDNLRVHTSNSTPDLTAPASSPANSRSSQSDTNTGQNNSGLEQHKDVPFLHSENKPELKPYLQISGNQNISESDETKDDHSSQEGNNKTIPSELPPNKSDSEIQEKEVNRTSSIYSNVTPTHTTSSENLLPVKSDNLTESNSKTKSEKKKKPKGGPSLHRIGKLDLSLLRSNLKKTS